MSWERKITVKLKYICIVYSLPYLDQLGHLLHSDWAVTINIEYPEDLAKHLFGGPLVHDEAEEVNIS